MPRKRSGEGKADPTPQQQWRQWLVQADHDASQDYDKTVLTLATGTLALSVTFAHDIAPTPAPGSSVLLACAWLALGISAVFVLASLLTSQRCIRDQIAELDQDHQVAPHGPAVVATSFLTIGSGVLLIAGLVAFAWFALANI
jgi:hypothetical protein